MRLGKAKGTCIKYVGALRAFDAWLGERAFSALTGKDIEDYLDWWFSDFQRVYGREPSKQTQRNLITALRVFFAYLDRNERLRDSEGHFVRNPMISVEAPRVEQRPHDWLRPEEDRAFLACECTLQERTIVWLLRWTGMRVGEAVSVRIRDLDFSPEGETIKVATSKTAAGRRVVPLVPELLPLVRTWLDHLRLQGLYSADAPLLSTRHGTAMKGTYVWRVVKRVSERAEIRVVACSCGSPGRRHESGCPRSRSGENASTVTPHTLRKTYGSHLLNNGTRLEVVSKMLGHQNSRITEQVYAELLDRQAHREVLQALGQPWAA